MGNNPSVVPETELFAPITVTPFLNRALITFVPSTTGFLNGFKAVTSPWMYKGVDNTGLVAELGENNWQARLKAMGAVSSEPIWKALDAHFFQQAVADGTGGRARLQKPDAVFIGRRLNAQLSTNTIEFTTNAAGSVQIKVNEANFIFTKANPTGSLAGSLADVTIEADGALTPTQLATAAAAALNAVDAFALVFLASSALGVVTIESLVEGYPLVVSVGVSTPGPIMELTVTTPNVADDYGGDTGDLYACQLAAESQGGTRRKFYWVTDLAGDDFVNDEGMAWVEKQGDKGTYQPIRPYQFHGWSTSGDKSILLGADLVGNFDPNATASASQVAQEAAYTRSSVVDHDRWEFAVPMMFGRTIAYKPGEVSFTSKVLYGQTPASRCSTREMGDNEYLSTERTFNWYGAEGPLGSLRWGYLADASFIDRKWLEDYATYLVRETLINWMQLKNLVAYSNDDIESGAGKISEALASIPAIDPTTIRISFLKRAQVSGNDIALRRYNFYTSFGVTFGIINSIGSFADPIKISLLDG